MRGCVGCSFPPIKLLAALFELRNCRHIRPLGSVESALTPKLALSLRLTKRTEARMESKNNVVLLLLLLLLLRP